jgi:uncharacterized protein (DUF697 family)/tellurite resistance protein
MDKSEQESVVAIALLAAFSDGDKDEAEHAAIRRVAVGFKLELVDMAGLYQQVITGDLNLEQAAAGLKSDKSRTLAYEVARCICEADGVMHPEEEKFLTQLTATLRPGSTTAAPASQPVSSSSQPTDSRKDLVLVGPISDPQQPLEPTLIKYSVLTAALELLPQTAGVLAILPVQLKMVYDISKRHGIEIDHQSVKDFGAALGIGAAGQLLESGLRRLLSSVVGSVGGSTAGSMSSGVAGTAMTFATTYALGTVANQYYAAGRKVDIAAIKTEFSSLLEKAKVTQAQYTDDITTKAKELTEMIQGGSLTNVLGGLMQGKF